MKKKIKLSVNNFRMVKGLHHVLLHENMTILCGQGHIGKTSMLYAMEAAITGDAAPWRKNKKETKLAAQKVPNRNGDGTAYVVLTDYENETSISYPDGTVDGTGLDLKVITARNPLASCPMKERSERLNAMLHTIPSREELENELKGAGMRDSIINAIWSQISGSGWDAACSHAESKAKEMKGAWRQITGSQYGPSKSEGWTPAEWTPDLANIKISDLEAEKVQAYEFLTAALKHQGASEQALSTLEEQVSSINDVEKKLSENKKAQKETIDAIESGKDKIAILEDKKKKSEASEHKCPGCGIDLVLINGKIEKYQKGKALTQKQEKELEDLLSGKKQSEDYLASLRNDEQFLNVNLASCKDAEKKLEAFKKNKTSDHDVKKAEDDYNIAAARLQASIDKEAADKKHNAIKQNTKIKEILSPDGLRKKTLRRGISHVNKILGSTCITLRNDLEFVIDGFEYEDLSSSLQHMVDYISTAVEAYIIGVDICIIDNTDRLDKTDRGVLYSFCYMLSKKSDKLRFVMGYMGNEFKVPESVGSVVVIGDGE